jgi:hypothetical protein
MMVEDLETVPEKVFKCNNQYVNQMWPKDVLKYIRKKIQDDAENDMLDQNREEWEHVARVLDRFLLIISMLFITLMAIVMVMANAVGLEI